MNLDLSSIVPFGDAVALSCFMLDHRMVHEQTATALSTQLGQSISTFGIDSDAAQGEWIRAMQEQEHHGPALIDWLRLHADMHNTTYQLIFGTGTFPPDLSQADFTRPANFYGWMYVHQQIHDYEQAVLGLQ